MLAEKLFNSINNAEWASGKREIVCRCPFCGHSSAKNKKHLYISVSKDKPIMYNCFKCNSSGLADYKFLQLLGIKNQSLIVEIQNFNSSKLSENNKILINRDFNNYDLYEKNKIKYLSAFYSKKTESIVQKKLNYINNRLGVELNQAEWLNQKVILDISMFYNQIKYALRISDEDTLLILKEYIGFLSINNSCISLRHIFNNNLPRWLIINITNTKVPLQLNKSFSIPTEVSNTIYIAEGQFDILSIFNNLVDKKYGFFIAVSGSKYSSALEYLIERFHLMDINLEIYFDNDSAGESSIRFMKYYLNKFRFIYNGEINFHINKINKDFGVSRDKIDENIFKI